MKLNVKEIQETDVKYQDYLRNIRVEIINHDATIARMPEVLMSTWAQYPGDLTGEDETDILENLFKGKFLPAAFEFMNITVAISGINSHDVTHLLRYRDFTFLGDCTGDKLLNNRVITYPESYCEYRDEYEELMEKSMELYTKMMKDEKMTIQDARLVLPRTIETFYYVQMNLRDAVKFIMHRKDEQIQPFSDNVLALRLYQAIKKLYPAFHIDFNSPDMHYVNECNSEFKYKSSFFQPNEINAKHIKDEVVSNYGLRKDMYGADVYEEIKKECLQ